MQRLTATKEFCDVIDLDPYGTAIEFLDSALRALKDDGTISLLEKFIRIVVCNVYGCGSTL